MGKLSRGGRHSPAVLPPASVVSKYVPFTPARDMTTARDTVFNNNDYLLWHNVDKVMSRVNRYFSASLLVDDLALHRDDLDAVLRQYAIR